MLVKHNSYCLIEMDDATYNNVASFICGNDSIDSFFHTESSKYQKSSILVTYKLCNIEKTDKILALLTIRSSSVEYTSNMYNHIPSDLRNMSTEINTIPVIEIERLGTNEKIQRHGIGTLTIDLLKLHMRTSGISCGCRFLLANALYESHEFYAKNGFVSLIELDPTNPPDIVPMLLDILH